MLLALVSCFQRGHGEYREVLILGNIVCIYWFTPLARKPPSTASTCPVTKLAASEARNTAAPTNSSRLPKRRMGVRTRNSLPRGVPSKSARFRSVGNTPGAIAFTHTLCGAHSTASVFVSETTAALLAAYAATSKKPRPDDTDAIFTMRPCLRSIILRPKIWHARKVPVRLVSRMLFHSASLTSSVGVRRVIPAEFTKISTLPSSASTFERRASILGRSVTLEVIASD